MSERKYLPSFAELLDRMTITQLKEILIPEHRDEYSKEIKDILHDLNLLIKENNMTLTADLIRDIVILSQYNLFIWNNEAKARKEGIADNLLLSHGLNGIRSMAKNKIQASLGGRKDYKIDCVETIKDWIPSGY